MTKTIKTILCTLALSLAACGDDDGFPVGRYSLQITPGAGNCGLESDADEFKVVDNGDNQYLIVGIGADADDYLNASGIVDHEAAELTVFAAKEEQTENGYVEAAFTFTVAVDGSDASGEGEIDAALDGVAACSQKVTLAGSFE